MKILFLRIVSGCAVVCLLSGCVTTYKSLQMDSLSIDDYCNQIADANVLIAMDYDVLEGPTKKQYAKMERKNKVSLVALTVRNSGNQELNMLEDLLFQTADGHIIQPLVFEDAMESLVEPVTNDDNDGFFEVEVEGDLKGIFGVGRVVNDAKRVVSHVRFVEDMQEYYLEDQVLSPGKLMKGFLCLPVRQGTPVTISLR
jgi:hypothetical protein